MQAKPSPPPSGGASFSPSAVPLEDLFSALHRHAQSLEFDQAAKVADQVLAIAPGDEDAVRCKVVALIKSDAIDKALAAIADAGRLPIDLRFYKAYCLYRQNKLQEALDSLDGQERDSVVLQLESQILYRLGRMVACTESYEKLQRLKIDSVDLKTNIIAAMIAAGRASEVERTMDALKEMLMEEDYADEEIETELAPINVQLAYVRQLLGHTKNQLKLMLSTKDVSDSLRKLDRLIEKSAGSKQFQLAHGLDFKLSLRQKEALYSNRVLLLLQANRIDQAQELVSALPEMFPDSVAPALLQAAVFSKPALLALAQIAAAANHFQISADSLSKVPDIQHTPATVATLVTLKERSGDIDGALAVLDSAIQWWKNAMTEDSKLDLIMQETASFKLNHGREQEAAQLYEELVKNHQSVEALVGLISTAARTNIEKAEHYEKQLRPLAGLKGINAESLEKTGGRRLRPCEPRPAAGSERWLPKRERSSYRPKRKDKRAQLRGSQGAVAGKKHDITAAASSGSFSGGASASKPAQDSAGSTKGASQNVASSEQPKASRKSKKKSRS
uniref:Signal recognition particle subunit SRP72 n=1 Tax=Ananas comosus var. bracteatus TaxID=296719 RepID=A0A6V7QZ83_ANACO